jgi:hypothetical protein
VANVSYLRSAADDSPRRWRRRLDSSRPARRWPYFVAALLLVLAGAVVAAIVFDSSHASLSADSTALAKVALPLGGGKIESATVVTGPHSRQVPIVLQGEKIYPRGQIGVGQAVTVDVVVKRPGWLSWLTGKTEHLQLTLRTPAASLREHYLTVPAHTPLRLQFKQPVAVIWTGPAGGRLTRHQLPSPETEVTLPRGAEAGTMSVAAAPRTWERAGAALVSWFPAGAAASAVATPAPGGKIGPGTPITLTFSKPLRAALGSDLPPVSPRGAGSWHTVGSHAIVFRPQGYGYGLGTKVTIALPKGVRLVGGQQTGSDSSATWTVPPGSALRLQQLLANLGYLPLRFNYAGRPVAHDVQAQVAAAVNAPAGRFSWRYDNVPSALRSFWAPGASGVMTHGALMAFQNDHGLTADGTAGHDTWQSLINAAAGGHHSTFGYTFVTVSEGSPETLTLWHNGHTVLTVPVNTGIPQAPTVQGTFPVFEHISSGTMSGTNPDGSHYSDPGIPWISYFNGGDALHGFLRAQYGSPQSLGCVEMDYADAGRVWPYTPVGTLVHVV